MKQVYSNIEFTTGAQVAGICEVKIIPREWLDSDPVVDFATGKILTALDLLPYYDFFTLSFTQDSYEYNEKPKSNRGGSYYEISCNGTINDLSPALQQVLETYRYHEFVAIIKDRKFRDKVVGDMSAGMTLSFENKNTNAQGGTQTGTISLLMESEDLPPFYEP